jgi:hypothetical protein
MRPQAAAKISVFGACFASGRFSPGGSSPEVRPGGFKAEITFSWPTTLTLKEVFVMDRAFEEVCPKTPPLI